MNEQLYAYGIQNCASDFACHITPLLPAAYWYSTARMVDFIVANFETVVRKEARSLDGSVTGAGYLVPCSQPFIREIRFDAKYIPKDWEKLSHGERGREAEELGALLVEHGILNFPFRKVECVESKDEQISGIDSKIHFCPTATVQWKADIPIARTGNLFVQVAERGHKHNLVPGVAA